MNIMFCGDRGVCQGIFLSALSICKNIIEPINFYILTASVEGHQPITQEFANEMELILKTKNNQHRVILFDISDRFQSYLPLANMNTRFTPMCMLRLFADMVAEIPEKVLYLDTDVLCYEEFSEMYEMDMSDYEIAGVPDRYGKWFFGNALKHNYLNSGVLLLNMKKIRETSLFEKCREMCRDRKMFMPDQTALNKLARKRKIPSRYNNQGDMREDTVFKHFTTSFRFLPRFEVVTVKPWQVNKMHDELGIFEFDDIIEEYKGVQNDEQRDSDLLYN